MSNVIKFPKQRQPVTAGTISDADWAEWVRIYNELEDCDILDKW